MGFKTKVLGIPCKLNFINAFLLFPFLFHSQSCPANAKLVAKSCLSTECQNSSQFNNRVGLQGLFYVKVYF